MPRGWRVAQDGRRDGATCGTRRGIAGRCNLGTTGHRPQAGEEEPSGHPAGEEDAAVRPRVAFDRLEPSIDRVGSRASDHDLPPSAVGPLGPRDRCGAAEAAPVQLRARLGWDPHAAHEGMVGRCAVAPRLKLGLNVEDAGCLQGGILIGCRRHARAWALSGLGGLQHWRKPPRLCALRGPAQREGPRLAWHKRLRLAAEPRFPHRSGVAHGATQERRVRRARAPPPS